MAPPNRRIWTTHQPSRIFPASTLAALTQAEESQGPCSSALWAHDVGGYRVTYEDGGGGFQHTALVTSMVREAPTDDAANAQGSFVTSGAYGACVHNEFIGGLQFDAGTEGFTVNSVSVDPLTLDTAIPDSEAYVINAIVSDRQGNQLVLTIDHVEMIVGRYEGTLDITTNPALGIDQNSLLQSQAERTMQRLQALPPNGTIVSRSI